MSRSLDPGRHIGLFGATCIGVGAIVGGGILALAGTAFERTGSGALLAFALNGVIAGVTALSFAELSTAFPRSGGPYVFAKRILTVGAAFAVGWIVWFASIVAAVLYALGFAAFLVGGAIAAAGSAGAVPPEWAHDPRLVGLVAATAIAATTLVVARTAAGGGNAVNIAKVGVFAVLVGGGIWAWIVQAPAPAASFRPFLPRGVGGLFQAMGFTFIALQGFDLVAAVAGEVKDPRRTLPRAMFIALGVAIGVYLPLLAVVVAVGVPDGTTLADFVAANRDTVLAEAARNYLGPPGFWLVVAAGILSMFSALFANVYAASRIAQVMGRDRTLPSVIERAHSRLGTPVVAVTTTAAIAFVILVAVPDVASAGAASSLIFLITFALANVLCVVARRRKRGHGGFRVPLWPWLPIAGAVACTALAVFQGVTVPAAGLVAAGWLVAGALCYVWLFAGRARVRDAIAEVNDADLLTMRGRSPLVLVPTQTASKADVLALLGACVAPPRVGRVLMLHVVPPLQSQLPDEFARNLEESAAILRDSLGAAVHAGARTEALATIAHDPWIEIERVANTHRCATLVVGMSHVSDKVLRGQLEGLASSLACNLVLARIPDEWRPEGIQKALVPIRGGPYSALRAQLLASLRLRAAADMEVVYLLVLPSNTSKARRLRRERSYADLMRTEASTPAIVRTVLSDDVGAAIAEETTDCDMLILGLSQVGPKGRVISEMTRKIIANTECAALVISERR